MHHKIIEKLSRALRSASQANQHTFNFLQDFLGIEMFAFVYLRDFAQFT
jgi:hypothetical protein